LIVHVALAQRLSSMDRVLTTSNNSTNGWFTA